jgi:hypothetical protein
MLHTFQYFSFRCPFSNNLSAFLWTQCNTSEFHTFRCSVCSKSFGIFTNLMRYFKVLTQNLPQFFRFLRCFSAQIPFCVSTKPTLLKTLPPQVFCVHKIISLFYKALYTLQNPLRKLLQFLVTFLAFYTFYGFKTAFNGFGAP